MLIHYSHYKKFFYYFFSTFPSYFNANREYNEESVEDNIKKQN